MVNCAQNQIQTRRGMLTKTTSSIFSVLKFPSNRAIPALMMLARWNVAHRVVFSSTRAPRRRRLVPIKVDTIGCRDRGCLAWRMAPLVNPPSTIVRGASSPSARPGQPEPAAVRGRKAADRRRESLVVIDLRRATNGRGLPNMGLTTGQTPLEAGAVMGDDLPPLKARIRLTPLLQNGADGSESSTAPLAADGVQPRGGLFRPAREAPRGSQA